MNKRRSIFAWKDSYYSINRLMYESPTTYQSFCLTYQARKSANKVTPANKIGMGLRSTADVCLASDNLGGNEYPQTSHTLNTKRQLFYLINVII